jgi:hypothetical protein
MNLCFFFFVHYFWYLLCTSLTPRMSHRSWIQPTNVRFGPNSQGEFLFFRNPPLNRNVHVTELFVQENLMTKIDRWHVRQYGYLINVQRKRCLSGAVTSTTPPSKQYLENTSKKVEVSRGYQK